MCSVSAGTPQNSIASKMCSWCGSRSKKQHLSPLGLEFCSWECKAAHWSKSTKVKQKKDVREQVSWSCEHCKERKTTRPWASVGGKKFCSGRCKTGGQPARKTKPKSITTEKKQSVREQTSRNCLHYKERKTKPTALSGHKRRCESKGLPHDPSITLESVTLACKGKCFWCKQRTLDVYEVKLRGIVQRIHRLCPTLDHVAPLMHPHNTKHGHTIENVVLCCHKCNTRKGVQVQFEGLLESENPIEFAHLALLSGKKPAMNR